MRRRRPDSCLQLPSAEQVAELRGKLRAWAELPRHKKPMINVTLTSLQQLPRTERVVDLSRQLRGRAEQVSWGSVDQESMTQIDLVSLLQLPSGEQVAELSGELRSRAELPRHVTRALAELPPGTHPMTQLSIAVLALQVRRRKPCRNFSVQQRRHKHPPSHMSSAACLAVAAQAGRQRTSSGMCF